MKRFILLCALWPAAMIILPSPAVARPRLMPACASDAKAAFVFDSTPEPDRNPVGEEPPVPLTDRTPWLVHVILITPGVVLAWIMFSLARGKIRKYGSLSEPGK